MRIGVIGSGWLGGSVGRAWVKSGHEVLFSSRNPLDLASMAREFGARATAGTVAEAAAFGPVVLIATPYAALPAIGREHAVALKGKIVLDASNPWGGEPLQGEAERDGVGVTSARLLPGTRLVRAFSAVDATAVEASAAGRRKLAVPLAGGDKEAVETAAQLVRDAGCEPLVVGDLAAARSFQRHGPGFRANTGPTELRLLLGVTN